MGLRMRERFLNLRSVALASWDLFFTFLDLFLLFLFFSVLSFIQIRVSWKLILIFQKIGGPSGTQCGIPLASSEPSDIEEDPEEIIVQSICWLLSGSTNLKTQAKCYSKPLCQTDLNQTNVSNQAHWHYLSDQIWCTANTYI